jgi:hypothetical protein
MWNPKTLKIQKKFQKLIQIFKTSKVLYHIKMGYNIHDVLNKTVVYIQENIKIKKINFWL